MLEEKKEDFDLAATSASMGAVVAPELPSEEDRYVVVPDEWEGGEQREDEGEDTITEDEAGQDASSKKSFDPVI